MGWRTLLRPEIALIGAFIFSLSTQTSAQQLPKAPTAVLEQMRELVAVVRPKCPGTTTSGGFGFVVAVSDSEALVVTAAHVLGDINRSTGALLPGYCMNDVDLRFYSPDAVDDQFNYRGSVLETIDVANDVAFVRFQLPAGRALGGAIGSPTTPIPGDDAWYIGRGSDWFVPPSPAKVLKFNAERDYVFIEGVELFHQSSGSPLITRQGVIGMLQENVALSSGYAIDIGHVEQFFQAKLSDKGWRWTLLDAPTVPRLSSLRISRSDELDAQIELFGEGRSILVGRDAASVPFGTYQVRFHSIRPNEHEVLRCSPSSVVIRSEEPLNVAVSCEISFEGEWLHSHGGSLVIKRGGSGGYRLIATDSSGAIVGEGSLWQDSNHKVHLHVLGKWRGEGEATPYGISGTLKSETWPQDPIPFVLKRKL